MSVPERYSPQGPSSGRLRLEHEARYRFAAQLAQGHDVADLGAGAGLGALACLQAGAKSAAAVDRSGEACELSRRALAGWKNAEVVEAELENLPWTAPRFDVALLLEVIEHLGDPGPVLAKIKKILRPGGFLLVSTPAVERFPNPHHERVFSKSQLGAALREHFPHVRLFRQGSLAASAVVADARQEAQVSVETGGPEYWLALASGQKIVRRVVPVFHAGPLSEYEAGTLRRLESDIRHLERERDGLRRDLEDMRRSPRWRVTGRLLRWMGLPR